jgi:hypothetical protein
MDNMRRIMDYIIDRQFASTSALLPPFAGVSAPTGALTPLKAA